MSFEVILPFLRPIEHLIRDGDISEIMVNGSGRIFIERHGELLAMPDATIPEKSLQVAVRNIARTLGEESTMRCHCLMHACQTALALPQPSRRARAGGRRSPFASSNLDVRKKGLRQVSLDEPSNQDPRIANRGYASVDERLTGSLHRIALARAIQELPAGYRTIFLLHEIKGYEHPEIARIFGVRLGTRSPNSTEQDLGCEDCSAPQPRRGRVTLCCRS